ncbi:MAG: hypothetical protein IJV01_05490 [Bacteroidales bacterium]|nr:hypothetical protein [Bacteroidales bacterium]
MLRILLLPLMALQWTVGVGSQPAEYVPATVPGACQADIAAARNYPDWKFSDNYELYRWMEDETFTYRTVFDAPRREAGQSVWFRAKGIDYECVIILNGQELARHEGALSPVNVCLDAALRDKGNELRVQIAPVPKRKGVKVGRDEASWCCKPPVSYGWDWHPRLIPSGIWDEASIEIRNAAWLEDVHLGYRLSDDFSRADIRTQVRTGGQADGACIRLTLRDRDGKEVFAASAAADQAIEGRLDAPRLWWTWDHGEPYLYSYELRLTTADGRLLDSRSGQTGFRRVRLVMNEGSWKRLKSRPMSRNDAPTQIELNGRPIFAKGSNWVAPEVFNGQITRERYQELIGLARKANFNIFRCWGGCAPGKDSFFEECDRAGILVWQEFPLSCNKYPDDPHYLAVLEQEARAMVERIRNHPCLALWCGGNELFNAWSRMDDQSLPLRLLNKVCYEMTPEIAFLPTSPLNGMAHGNYVFRDGGKVVHEWMDKASASAYTEFGVGGLSPRSVLERIIPADELFPPRRSKAWIAHHAYDAWDANRETWLCIGHIEYYYGKPSSLDELIELSSIMQGEGYKAIFEEARRQKPFCAMALNWDYNEPWPAAANNSILAYPAIEKGCFGDVAAACRPVCASAKFTRYQWGPGDELELGLWLLNDSYDSGGQTYSLRALLVAPDGKEQEIGRWTCDPLQPNRNARGPQLHATLPRWDGVRRFGIRVCVDGHPEMDSRYTLAYKAE